MRPHDPLKHFGFKGGEVAQVYARDTRLVGDAPLAHLADGEAETHRADCRAGHLICPIPECADPRYTTVGGSRRHHFRHHVRTDGHGTESWFHHIGKQLILEWLRDRHPEAESWLEKPLEDKQRPDVLAVFPDGHRFGFEIQYSPITPEEWLRRHERYEAQGISDVWLFGHTRPHFRPIRAEWLEDMLRLGETLAAVQAAGQPIRFLNPDERTIATQRIETARHRSWRGENFEVGIDPLERCRIEGNAFLTLTDLRERRALEVRLAAEAANEEEEKRRLAAQTEQERLERERADEKAAWVAQQRKRQQDAWEEYKPGFLVRTGLETVPEIVERENSGDRGIFLHPAHWHGLLFEREIHGRIGEWFSFERAAAPFASQQAKRVDLVWIAIRTYLFRLRRAGYLWTENDGGYIHKAIVLADLVTPPGHKLDFEARRQASWPGIFSFEGDLVVASHGGEVLRTLRPLRDGDQIPALEERLEQPARDRAGGWEGAEGGCGPSGGPPAGPVTSALQDGAFLSGRVVLKLPGWLVDNRQFRLSFRELCHEHEGEQRLGIEVVGAGRYIQLPDQITDSGDFQQAVDDLVSHYAANAEAAVDGRIAS